MDQTRSAVQLLDSVACLSLSESIDAILPQRLEASTRVGNAYEGLVCCWSNSPVDACSWVMDQIHTPSTAVDIMKGYAQMVGAGANADLDLKSWYEDQVAAISSFQGEMNLMGAILDSLNPVSTETLCPTNSRISSIIWGSFSYLLIEANPEGGLSLAIEQRGIFVRSHLVSILCEVAQILNFSSSLTWIPACPFVSGYAAQGLSEMYKILAEFLGKVVEFQARATAATDEEQLRQIDEELLTGPAWIDERLFALKQAGERLCAAASEEKYWRDAAIKSQLEESERLSDSGNLHEACLLLERRNETLKNAPAPPQGVEPRQLQFMIWTELHKLSLQMLDQQRVALYAAKLYFLLSHMLGKHSVSTLSSSYRYATSISRLGMGNTTARDILSAGYEGAKAAFGPDSNITGILYGRLGKEMALLAEVDGIPQMLRALNILENHLDEENAPEFEELANDIWDILLSQAKPEDARSLVFRASESCKQKLGSDHIITCKYLGDLGYINLSMGNATEAKAILLDALARLERTVGNEHAETQRAMSNLASVYRSQSQQEDCIRLNRRVLEIRESTIGPKSWGTLMSMSNLGVSLREFGANEEAKTVLMEARRRLEELPTPFKDVVDYVATGLRGLEDESEVEASILRAEERLKAINMTDDLLLTRGNAMFISDLISLYLGNGRLDDAYRLAKQAGKATQFYNGEGKKRWDFSEVLCDILVKMPEREDELVETCREALDKLDIESDKSKDTIARREIALGSALLRTRQEEEGVRIIMRGMDRAKHLDEQSRLCYRAGIVHLFRHYTHSMLASDNIDSSSKSPEFWDRVVKLIRPERGANVF